MVARINSSKNISKAINYNEQKVKEGTAELLQAKGFLKPLDQLNFYEKKRLFEKYTSLNKRVTTNAVHVSLNFDPTEKLDDKRLLAIAERYMQGIGFKEQPYLVYRHHDTAHPHIHIVTTNIKNDGSRISLHNIGKAKSEPARKEIEQIFQLIKAEEKSNLQDLTPGKIIAQKIEPGKRPAKAAIANVLHQVISVYRYASLHELNAVLSLYNVKADRGTKGSLLYKRGGLLFRILNGKGEAVGTPIKASLFSGPPTWKNIQQNFEKNHAAKWCYANRIRSQVDYAIKVKHPTNLPALIALLEREQISVVTRKNVQGFIYGMTYVDHKTKVVFNGSDLGKVYSAKQLQERVEEHSRKPSQTRITTRPHIITENGQPQSIRDTHLPAQHSLLNDLLTPEKEFDPVPYALRAKRKKKQRKQKRI